MDSEAIFARIREAFGDEGLEFLEETHQPTIIVGDHGRLLEFATFLRDDEELRCETLLSLGGQDRLEEQQLRTSYHAYSFARDHIIAFHVDVPRDDPRQPSIQDIWPAANWNERESYDLLGIIYEGHPDLRRIMLPDDWIGHPLRKDYEEQPDYNGVPTQREREWLSWQK